MVIFVLVPAFQETDASDLMLEGFRWSIGGLLQHNLLVLQMDVDAGTQCFKMF